MHFKHNVQRVCLEKNLITQWRLYQFLSFTFSELNGVALSRFTMKRIETERRFITKKRLVYVYCSQGATEIDMETIWRRV